MVVGLSNILDVEGRKFHARGEPVQRMHGAVVAPTLAGMQLPAKVVERPEVVRGIEPSPIYLMAPFY